MKKLFFLLIFLGFVSFPVKMNSAEEFLDLQCMSDIKSKYPCNVSFYRKFMKLNYPRSGRSNKVRYENIVHWNYSDSSLRKMDVGLAQRIGIIGLLFTKVEHQHVFTIIHKDEYGDRQVAILDFDKLGAIQFTLTFGASSEARLTVKPSTAAFAEAIIP